jgi:hypothetical protein
MKRDLIVLTLFCVLSQSCAKVYYAADNIYSSADAVTIAQNHHLVAVAPPAVSIETSEEIDIRALLFQQESISKDFQKETVNWLLKRKHEKKLAVEIQNTDTTNARLRRAGYYNDTLWSAIKICRTLGVDGVIISKYVLDKPMSAGQVLETGILGVAAQGTLPPGLRNKGLGPPMHASWPTLAAEISIYDLKTNKIIWTADHRLSVGVYSSARIVNGLFNYKNRKMPYLIK